MSGFGCPLKSQTHTPRFIGPYHILQRVREVALPTYISNLHIVFHVSQLRKYVHDPSHVIPLDDVQVRDNLTFETSPLQIEDREVKHLRGKEIDLVKMVRGPSRGSMTWKS